MNGFDLRPRTVRQVLGDALRLYMRNAGPLVALVACVVVPIQVAWAIVLIATLHHGDQVPSTLYNIHFHFVREANGTVRSTGDGRQVPGGITSGELIISYLVQLLATGACVRALADAAAGAAPSITGSLVAALRRLPALVVLYIVRSIGVIVGFICIIVPGVWLGVSWSVSVPALMLEGESPLRALGRSLHLVRGSWSHTFGAVILVDILVAIAGGVFTGVFGFIDGYSSHPSLVPAVLAVVIGSTVTALVVHPFNAAVRTVLYLDLRIRRGGDELDSLADQLGAPPLAPS